ARIIDHRGDARVEFDVAPEIERVRDVVSVANDFRLAGIALGPVPAAGDLVGEAVLIFEALHIAASARIAVPVPGSADILAGLERLHGKSMFAQAMNRIHAGE